ncbi:MutS protein msh4 [Conglomerata obtusa]
MNVFCIASSRGKIPLLGLSIIYDNKTINTYEFYDTYSYCLLVELINFYKPAQIIVNEDNLVLINILKTIEIKHKIIRISRKFYQSNDQNFFAQASMNAYFSFKKISCTDYSHTCCVLPTRMTLYSNTVDDLDLINNEKSVFETINLTCTKMGSKLLLQNILHPFTEKTDVVKRHMLFNDLHSKLDRVNVVRTLLNQLPDMDLIIEKLIHVDKLNKKTDYIDTVEGLLISCELTQSILKENFECFDLLKKNENEFSNIIHQLCTIFDKSDYFKVRSGINEYIDITKQMYNENKNDLLAEIECLKKQMRIEMDLIIDSNFGYVLKTKSKTIFECKNYIHVLEDKEKHILSNNAELHDIDLLIEKSDFSGLKEQINDCVMTDDNFTSYNASFETNYDINKNNHDKILYGKSKVFSMQENIEEQLSPLILKPKDTKSLFTCPGVSLDNSSNKNYNLKSTDTIFTYNCYTKSYDENSYLHKKKYFKLNINRDCSNDSNIELKRLFINHDGKTTNDFVESSLSTMSNRVSQLGLCTAENSKNLNDKLDGSYHEIYIIQKRKETVLFTTTRISNLNVKLIDCRNQINEIFYVHCKDTLKKCLYILPTLTKLNIIIAEIDLVMSFIQYSKKHDCLVPEIGDSIVINSTFHPILKKTTFTNNVYCQPKLYFTIVTGQNMSGKTTYVKQIAVWTILAQIGSPICASYACIKLFKKIYTRLNHNEDLENNLSSFVTELKEINQILKEADDQTLIIIDELGRGTNYEDGMAIAITTCKKLLEKKSYVYFITHFTEIIPLIKCSQINVLQINEYHLTSGVSQNSSALTICRNYFNEKIVLDAISIQKKLGKLNFIEFRNDHVQLALKILECKNVDEKRKLMDTIRNINDN